MRTDRRARPPVGRDRGGCLGRCRRAAPRRRRASRARADRHPREQRRHRTPAEAGRDHRGRLGRDRRRQPQVVLPGHAGRAPRHAQPRLRTDHQSQLGGRADRRRDQPAVRGLEGRDAGHDALLRPAPRARGHHRQRHRAGPDRNRHGDVQPERTRGSDPGGTLRIGGRSVGRGGDARRQWLHHGADDQRERGLVSRARDQETDRGSG